MWTEILLATFGIAAAGILVLSFRQSLAEARALRLAILAQRSRLQNIRLGKILVAENAKLVAKGVDHGALFLNAGASTVANLTYGILELIPATRGKARSVREKHMEIGEGITGALRAVNKHVGDRIAENIQKTPRRRKRRRRA